MSDWPHQAVFLVLLAGGLMATAAEPSSSIVTVAQDGSGDFNSKDHQPIQAAIARVRAARGGEIVIKPGEYLIGASLRIAGVTNLTVRGTPGAVLRLPPLPHAMTTAEASGGDTGLLVDRTTGFTNGTLLHITAPGKIHPFTGKPAPYFNATLARIEANRLVTAKPLEFAAPAGTRLYPENSPNIFELGAGSDHIVIAGLTLDGGRREGDPPISGHSMLCGVFAAGPYSYEGGPRGAPVRGLVVRDCVIRDCYGRGVAMYATLGGVVERCEIENTNDEAIDFDHFAVGCRAVGNKVAHCNVGVEFNDANDCLAASNRFDNCKAGIKLWRWCKQPELNVRNRVVDNEFTNNRSTCIRLGARTTHNTVQGNTIRDCRAVAISVDGANQRILSNTIIRAATNAIVITGEQNEVVGNRCYDNSAAEHGQYDGIKITGSKNRLLDNIVGSRSGKDPHRKAVSDTGKDNEVRTP